MLYWIRKHRSEIDGRGGNSNFYIKSLEPAIQTTIAANTNQEKMKATLKDQTKLLNQ